jgi:hypothetical protein
MVKAGNKLWGGEQRTPTATLLTAPRVYLQPSSLGKIITAQHVPITTVNR